MRGWSQSGPSRDAECRMIEHDDERAATFQKMRYLREGAREVLDILEREHADGRIERFVGKRHARSRCREVVNARRSELFGDSDELRRDIGACHNRTRRRERPREKSLSARDIKNQLSFHVTQHTEQRSEE